RYAARARPPDLHSCPTRRSSDLEISRQGGATRYEPRFSGAPRTEFVGYERTDVLTAITAYADLGDGLFQVKLAESPFYPAGGGQDRKSTRLNSSHVSISYAVFCL